MKPKFSIIVPVYNVAPYLRECLDSVLTQKVSDWECVCVDDGSTDGSSNILDQYAAKDSRFVIIHKTNGGVAAARNDALNIISGDWFLFLDADDVWSKNLLTVCEKAIAQDNKASMVKFGACYFNNEHPCAFDDIISPVVFAQTKMVGVYSHLDAGFFACAILYNSKLRFIRQKCYSVGEDILYLACCLMQAETILSTPIRLYGYRQRPRSAVRSANVARVMIESLLFHYDILELCRQYKKEIGKVSQRWIGNALSENGFVEMLKIMDLSERSKALAVWYDVLRRASKCPRLGVVQNFRIMILNRIHYRPIQWLLCGLPYALKRKGIHR